MFGLLFVISVCKYTYGSYVYTLAFTHLNLPLTPLKPLLKPLLGVLFLPGTEGRPDMHLSLSVSLVCHMSVACGAPASRKIVMMVLKTTTFTKSPDMEIDYL